MKIKFTYDVKVSILHFLTLLLVVMMYLTFYL